MDSLRPTCWKFGLPGVPVILIVPTLLMCFLRVDTGGGSVRNGTRHTLARIPLRWMIRQCFLANTGIQFTNSLDPGP